MLRSRYLISVKKLNVSSPLLNFRNNDPVSLLKTTFRYCNCFLSSVAKDGDAGSGFKLEKIGRFKLYVCINHQKG